MTDEGGYTTRYQRDANGNILQVVDPEGNRTKFQYDALNRLIAMIDPTGGETRWSYDLVGNVTAMTDPAGHVTKWKYGPTDKTVEIVDAEGHSTEFKRDAAGNILQIKFPGGKTYLSKLDKVYRPISITDPNGDAWRMTWDRAGLLISLTDPSSKITEFTRNVMGQVIKRSDSSGRVRAFSYDDMSQLARAVREDGMIEQYSRDNLGQLKEMTVIAPGKTEPSLRLAYAYDRSGNLTEARNDVTTLSFKYDTRGFPIEVRDSNSKATIRYKHDANGMRKKAYFNNRLAFAYQYDADNRLIGLTNEWNEKFQFAYYPDGLRSELIYPNGVTAHYGYDKLGNLTQLTYKDPSGAVLASYSYAYDEAGYVKTFKQGNETTKYLYDDKERLIKAIPPNGPAAEYSYDSKGNIVQATGSGQDTSNASYNKDNQLLKWGSETFKYDSGGRLIEFTGPDGHTNLTYNPLGLLTELKLPDGRTMDFQYGPLKRRIAKRSSKETRLYVYDGLDLTWELDGDRKTAIMYTHGPGLDEPLAVRKDGKSYFLHADALGSIRLVTDSNAQPQEKLAYQPFGSTKGKDKGSGGSYRYAGRILDRDTGLYYYRSRYYHPALARFITADPLGYLSGEHNHYVYARNNPVNYTDPFGAQPGKKTGGLGQWVMDQGRTMMDKLEAHSMTWEQTKNAVKNLPWKMDELGKKYGVHKLLEGSGPPKIVLTGQALNQTVSGTMELKPGEVQLTGRRGATTLPGGLKVGARVEIQSPEGGLGKGWNAKASSNVTLSGDSATVGVKAGPLSAQATLDEDGRPRKVSVGTGWSVGPNSPVNRVTPVGEPKRVTIKVPQPIPSMYTRINQAISGVADRITEEQEEIRKSQTDQLTADEAMARPDLWADPGCAK